MKKYLKQLMTYLPSMLMLIPAITNILLIMFTGRIDALDRLQIEGHYVSIFLGLSLCGCIFSTSINSIISNPSFLNDDEGMNLIFNLNDLAVLTVFAVSTVLTMIEVNNTALLEHDAVTNLNTVLNER